MLEAGTEAETVKEHCLVAYFPWLAHLPFLYSLDPPAQMWYCRQWYVPFYINEQSRKCPHRHAHSAI